MSKQDAELLREAALFITSRLDGSMSDQIADRLRARADELCPPAAEPWERVCSALVEWQTWSTDCRLDALYRARARHLVEVATEGTVPVGALEKLCAKWESEADEPEEESVNYSSGLLSAVYDLREVLAGREP